MKLYYSTTEIESISDFVDFGGHNCININQKLKFVFLGPGQREVFVKYVEKDIFGKKHIEYIRSERLPDSADALTAWL